MKKYLPMLAVFLLIAGFCRAENATTQSPAVKPPDGRALFLKNCAHCHGADGRGDEGPDLRDLDWTEGQIAARIRNGKKGKMTAFSGKLSPAQVAAVAAYVR